MLFVLILGADGPDQYASNVQHYLNNHISWLKQMNEHHSKFKQFRGIIVTGWQRLIFFSCVYYGILMEIFYNSITDENCAKPWEIHSYS